MYVALSTTLQLHSDARGERLQAAFDRPDRHFEKPLMAHGFWPDP
jgi:hypothetical protein